MYQKTITINYTTWLYDFSEPVNTNASNAIPTMIRYIPQILKPYFFSNDIKNFMANNATANATTFPMLNNFICSDVNAPFSFIYLYNL